MFFSGRSLIILIAIFFTSSIIAQNRLNVVPEVKFWEFSDDYFRYQNVCVTQTNLVFHESNVLIKLFKDELRHLGIEVVNNPTKKSLHLHFINTLAFDTIQKESYSIALDKKTNIRASTHEGFVNATRTILQLLSQDQYQNQLPIGRIKDYSSYDKRMLLIDVARKFFTIEEIKDFIRIMAWVKMNELHLHLSDNSWGGYSAYRLPSEKYPELTAKDGHYSWEQIRELQDFAKVYGITIVPEIDSPGHSLAFTNIRPDLKSKWLNANYLDITNPDTYTFMEEILEEVIPHFDAPDFHLGTDEYRIHRIKDDSLKEHIGNTFRKYINHFNEIVKRNGKTTRIWSGFENMPGDTKIDKDIIIDMWETSDAKDKSERGYQFINSSHYYTYIVPGAPYYGVDNKFVYEEWTPLVFSNKEEQNLDAESPGLLGSKMHIWNDFGPTGYSITEIARLSIESILIFSEKMWGSQPALSFDQYSQEISMLYNIPQTTVLNRFFDPNDVLLKHKGEIEMNPSSAIQIESIHTNLDYPWTLELTLNKSRTTFGDEVLLSSELATIYSDLEYTFINKKDTTTKRGIAIVRANQTAGNSPINSHRPQVIVFDYQIPIGKEVKVKIQGEKGKTSLYINDEFVDSKELQMLCPYNYIGDPKGNSFTGTFKNLKITQEMDKNVELVK